VADPRSNFRVLSLCSGYGGLDLGLRLALRRRARAVAFVERDARAAATLLGRMEEATLDPAPVFGDLFAFDAARWAGAVDCVAAGFPCQDHSTAGKRSGEDGERNLWPEVLRILEQSEAPFAFFENVRGILSSPGRPPVPGLDDQRVGRADGEPVRGGFLAGVLGDLAERGFDAEWSLLSAGAVGAPHRRDRWWLLAANRQRLRQWGVSDALGDALRLQPERGAGRAQAPDERNAEPGDLGEAVADPIGGRYPRRAQVTLGSSERRVAAQWVGGSLADAPSARRAPRQDTGAGGPNEGAHQRRRAEPERESGSLGDPDGGRREGQRLEDCARIEGARGHFPADQIHGSSSGRQDPEKPSGGRWSRPKLNPRFVEWLMGLPPEWTTATGCDCSATELCRCKPRWHSEGSRGDSRRASFQIWEATMLSELDRLDCGVPV